MVADRQATQRVLLVEDDPADAQLYQTMLQQLQADSLEAMTAPSVAVEHVETLEAALSTLHDDADGIDVVLLDLNLADSVAFSTLEAVLEVEANVAVVVLTGIDDGSLGLEAVERGAQDFLVKDHVTPRVLTRTVTYAIERKRRTLELERQRRELAVLNWLVRHEIRDDAAVVLGWIDELEPAGPTEERIVSRIAGAGDHIVELTESVGAMVQALEEPEPALESIHLETVLDEEITRLEERHDGISVDRESDHEASTVVCADRFLNVVVRNVLTNAVVHDDTDAPELSVRVRTVERSRDDLEKPSDERRADGEDDTVCLEIADTGPGIPATERRRVIEPNESGRQGGTGLGLYLVRTFVERYGGHLEIEANQPRGTVVRILLESAA
ncbi:response regulator [Natronolimnobius sp. AArcel1]|uniref:hybrid sensor histidine kinase/response regulator n=1 Tax=Natronolimnobius sp. AArcel1 TaxID=1679093 RepID=UPI0013EDD6E5|nr:hybrid sensor histidine kinase/response regulator [Natronolimnobius sp. AArcel1]NGM68610.1 response regulator [Natronolimnobius sp. AArcel1]